MAVFYPNLDQIRNDTMEKHTTGELSLLEELEELPDDYNVYYQHTSIARTQMLWLNVLAVACDTAATDKEATDKKALLAAVCAGLMDPPEYTCEDYGKQEG